MTRHILLVEDDQKARDMLAYLLRYEGYHVRQAPNGETALDLLEQEHFDVVLTDIVMGDVDGIEVLHTARMQPYRPAVILLTGHGTLETCMAALRAGAYDYLLKPCRDEDLLTCVARACAHHQAEQQLANTATLVATLARTEADAATPDKRQDRPGPARAAQSFQVGQLVVGIHRRDVTLAGQPIHTTPIEYALLRCLAETPGTARSYSELVQHSHGLSLEETEAQTLLRVHISNLRKKLDPAYLVNDRGHGYTLIDPT